MKNVLGLFMVAGILCLFGAAMAADIDVSQPTNLTDNDRFDRNPSVIYDGSDYWLFYTKGDNGGVRGVGGYDPDADSYVVYYKTASSLSGLTAATETKLDQSETGRPVGFDQRVVSTVPFDGKIYAFVSSGQSGTDRGLYYYTYDGGWTGPTQLIADGVARGGHVNVASDGIRIYIVWESSDGSADCYTWDGTTLSAKVNISADNQPKVTFKNLAKGGNLYVAGIEDGTGDVEIYLAEAAPLPVFSHHSTAIAGAGLYDPCIFNDGTDLYVVVAPYVPTDRQYLIQARFDWVSSTWASSQTVSYGGYGATEWWDFWPCGYSDASGQYVFFTTEATLSIGSPTLGDAEIGFVKMDWDLSRNHYFYIQNGVSQASAGDIIHVAPGTYCASNIVVAKG
ncbi:MAG: hypothetical protein PHR28_11120, partial [candidate division Zixibacteria bacterium]|nr:hypothetical protein [candidate division Zixibacteria bacterium]